MRRLFCPFLLSVLLLFTGPVRPQSLEIHQICVGQGDASLIIQRNIPALKALVGMKVPLPPHDIDLLRIAIDNSVQLAGTVTHAVLIDLGPKGQESNIQDYIRKMGIGGLDYILISHYHEDHIAGSSALIPINPLTVLYDRGPAPTVTSKVYRTYRAKAGSMMTAPVTATTASTFSFAPAPGSGLPLIQFQCVAANKQVLSPGVPPVGGRSPNDVGVAWLITYGTFRYYTGGDLGGYKKSAYVDVETPMARGVQALTGNGHVCAMKIDHHGSEYSSNATLLGIFSPSMSVISCAKKNKFGHPSPKALARITANIPNNFNTFNGKDIILIVDDAHVAPVATGIPHTQFVVLEHFNTKYMGKTKQPVIQHPAIVCP